MAPDAASGDGPSFTVLVPVGPGEHEVERLRDTLASVDAHCAGHDIQIVIVDDGPARRELAREWPEAEVVRTGAWEGEVPDPLTAHVAGTLVGLAAARGSFALKLDTDALVIGSFAETLATSFKSNPSVGVVGAYDRSPDGMLRDWSMWRVPIRRSAGPVKVIAGGGARGPRIAYRRRTERSYIRSVIAAAQRNPSYQLGAHCLGGAYAVSGRLLAHAREWDWQRWAQSGLGEDVVLGLLCASAGLQMRGMVGDGEPFGVCWRDLPAPPPELVERGFTIVHSVKDGQYGTEAELRAWFRANAVPR